MTQKLTGIIYSCLPYIVTSIVISSAETSVYGVYMLVFNSIKSLGQVVIQAPKNALGQLYAYDNKINCCQIFKKYNFFSISIISILISVTIILILPFITLYVKGVNDINYIRPVLCGLLTIVSFLELIHIPSGLMINLSGDFAISKKIQLIATMVLLILGIPLINIFGLIGMVIAQLCCNLYLCFTEIYYAHRKVLKINLFECIKVIIIGVIYILIMFFIVSYVQNLIVGSFTWLTFILCGFIDLIIGIIIYMLFCIIFFRENFIYFINLIKNIIFKKNINKSKR